MTDVPPVEFGPDYAADGPLREATPYLRLVATAEFIGVDVFDLPEQSPAGLAGSVSAGFNGDEVVGLVGLVPGLDEDLRTDVLAFGIAAFAVASDHLLEQPHETLLILRDRLPAVESGPGYLARYIAAMCGRNTPSAMFQVQQLLLETNGSAQ